MKNKQRQEALMLGAYVTLRERGSPSTKNYFAYSRYWAARYSLLHALPPALRAWIDMVYPIGKPERM